MEACLVFFFGFLSEILRLDFEARICLFSPASLGVNPALPFLEVPSDVQKMFLFRL